MILDKVRLGATGVELSFAVPAVSQETLRIVIAIQSGWLVADVACLGWVGNLPPPQRAVLTTALVGLYKSAGVELVRQQLIAAFYPDCAGVCAYAGRTGGLAGPRAGG